MPIEVLREKADGYVEKGLLTAESAALIMRVIESERGMSRTINDREEEDADEPAAAAPPAANEADLEGPGRAGGQGYVEADNRAAGGRPLHEPATRYVRFALFTHRILLLRLVGRFIQTSEATP